LSAAKGIKEKADAILTHAIIEVFSSFIGLYVNFSYIYGYQNNNMIRKVILFLFFLLFINLTVSAQTGGGHFIERVVEIKNFTNAKHVPLLAQLLQDFSENSAIILSCEEQGWVVFKIDLSEMAGDEQLAVILKTAGMEYVIKEGADKKDVVNACKGNLHKF